MRFATTSPLLAHQEAAVAKLLPSRVGAMFMEMGTGKSRVLLELARLRQEKFDRLVWFCPVSLKRTVLSEIRKHTDLPAGAIHLFDDRTSERTVPLDCRVYVVGIESMQSSSRVTQAVNRIVTERSFVAVDESSYIKGNRAMRTKRILRISERARYRVIMTGTPFTQGIVDLFAQMKFLSPKILGYQSFWAFANEHLEFEERADQFGNRRRTGRIVSSHDHEVLAARMAPYVYQVRKDECLTLPEKVHETWTFKRSLEQKEAHDRAKEIFLLERMAREPWSWTPIELFRLFTALQTIACGWWNRGMDDPNADGPDGIQRLEHKRLEMLLAVTHQIPEDEKVVVWTKYRRATDDVMAALAGWHGPETVARYDGTLSEAARDAELARWRRDARFLVATQSCGSHGLTLNEAAHAVFYADGFKYSERAQAEDRIHRIGQSRTAVYHTLVCEGSIDERIQSALSSKGHALRDFMNEVQAVRAEKLRDKALALVRSL